MVYTLEERIELVRLTYATNIQEASRLFHQAHPEKPILHKGTLWKLIKRFEETGKVEYKPRPGRPRTSTTIDKAVDILTFVGMNPTTTIRNLASMAGTSYTSTQLF